MTNTGAFLWTMVFVLLIIGLLRKGGEDGDEHEDNDDHLSDDQELEKYLPKTDTKQHRGGCCG
jgi:hypothetical protein